MNVFTRYLIGKGHTLCLYDVDLDKVQIVAEKIGCPSKDNLEDLVALCDFILICTPIRETPNVIRSLGSLVMQGKTICEITSLKNGVVKVLKSLEDVCTLSLHPMFGPDVRGFKGQTMAMIPVKNPKIELEVTKKIFPEVKLIEVSVYSHDKIMAYVLSLPYFMNLVFAHSLVPSERDLMHELAGTTFRAQTIVKDCVVGESSEFVESLINGNVFSWEVINQFIDEAKYLRRLFKRGDEPVDGYCRELKKEIEDEALIKARRLRDKVVNV